ncbi:MAG: alpha/beta hydrolase family protein, partial [Beijerinckiaceae bacterium]
MNALRLFGMAAALCLAAHAHAPPARAQQPDPAFKPGPASPEGQRMREQFWLVPAGDNGNTLMWTTLFRPPGAGPFPLAVLNHGTGAERQAMGMPTFFWLARLLVNAGYAVAVPVRRGYGATAGVYREIPSGGCARANYLQSEMQAARDIRATINFFRDQPFVQRDGFVVGGSSTGGLASLATAGLFPDGIAGVINFAGGRGGRAGGRANNVCNPDDLV